MQQKSPVKEGFVDYAIKIQLKRKNISWQNEHFTPSLNASVIYVG